MVVRRLTSSAQGRTGFVKSMLKDVKSMLKDAEGLSRSSSEAAHNALPCLLR